MVDLGLKLQLVKNRETMQNDFEIEPPVFHVCRFPSESTVKQMTLSNSTKTLLSAEIDRQVKLLVYKTQIFNDFNSREKIRRREASMSSMTEARNLTAQATISPAMRAVIMPPKPKGNG